MVAQYLARIVDSELDTLLAGVSAVSIEGPRAVGKTATAIRRAASVFALDDPAQHALLAADPRRITAVAAPVLVDEWQLQPPLWDVVRRSVDENPAPGRFLLTGSAEPADAPTHSGAGRIVRLRMRPMCLAERGLAESTVSLRELLAGERPDMGGSTDVDLSVYADEVVRSGFPAIRILPDRARRAQIDGYLDRIVEHDFAEQGHSVRRPAVLRSWLTAYAAATATTTSYNAIMAAATPGDAVKPAKTTTIGYRDVLSQLWLLDPVPGWSPTRNHFSRLVVAPKHHLADPAFAARLLGADADALLDGTAAAGALRARDGVLLGRLFESLVTLGVQVLAEAAEATVRHLRTGNGDHEVDLIVERADHRVVAIEVKLGTTVRDADVRHLHWLRERIGDDLLDVVVINTGAEAYRRPDGVAVVPACLLGP